MADLAGKDYFTVPEAAEYAGISVSHWRARIQREFPPGEFYGKLIYRRTDVQRFIDSRPGKPRRHNDFGYYHGRSKRTPSWADRGLMLGFYRIARRISQCTGIRFHVDHIIPLCGRLVSGLHVPANLRVIPAKINVHKSSKFEIQ